MQPNSSDAPLGARLLFRRAMVIVPLSVVIAALSLSIGVSLVGLLVEGGQWADVLGRAYFGVVWVAPFAAVGLIVLCSLAAALAVLVALNTAEPASARIQRIVWARTYAISVTAVVLAFTVSIYTSAPVFLLVVATVPVSLYALSLFVFNRRGGGGGV